MDNETPTENTSPFSGLQQTVDGSVRRRKKRHQMLLGIGLPALLVAFIAIYFLSAFRDPLRTLETFPTERYYENPATLQGANFRASVKALDQLDWSEKDGRLIVFKVGKEERPLVILIPPSINTLQFAPGEKFVGEVSVTSGGMIKAISMRKE